MSTAPIASKDLGFCTTLRDAVRSKEGPLPSRDLGDDVHLAVRRNRLQPSVLVNFAVDRDRDAVFQMRLQGRVALTEDAQQLADVRRVDLDLALAARELRQRQG